MLLEGVFNNCAQTCPTVSCGKKAKLKLRNQAKNIMYLTALLQTGTRAQTKPGLFSLEWSILKHTDDLRAVQRQQRRDVSRHTAQTTAVCFFFLDRAAAQSESFSEDCSKLHSLFSVLFHATVEAPGSGADVRTCKPVAGFVGAPEPAGTAGDSKWQELRLTGRSPRCTHDWRLTLSELEFYY